MFSITSLFSHKGAILNFFPLQTTVKQYRPPSLVRSPVPCVSPCPQIACSVCVTVPTDCLFSVCHRAHRLPLHSISISPCPQIACSYSQCVSQCPQIACSFSQCVTVPTDCLFIQSVCVTVPTDCLFIQSVYHRARRLPVHTVSAYHRAHRLLVHSVSVSPCPQIVCSFNQRITVPTDCLFIQSVRITVPTEG